jgi:2-(1,2-epoxy-1,2-dihydrophenyl)acetyl-CoA isomerase
MFEFLTSEKKDGVAVITLNRPNQLNALNMPIREELKAAFEDVNKDDEIGAVVLRGAGRSFCAGGDISTLGESEPNTGRKRLRNIHPLLRGIMDLDKPVICAVQGHAVGGGLGLALAGDLVIAAEDAKFCCSFVKIGLVPDWATFYMLPRLVGLAKAREMALMATVVDAKTALDWGLVSRVVPNDQLLDEAMKTAKRLAAGPRTAIALCKQIMAKSLDMNLEEVLGYEAFAQDLCMQTKDHREGIQAFKEKRKPVYNQK